MSEQKNREAMINELVEYRLHTMTVQEVMALAKNSLTHIYYAFSEELVKNLHTELLGGNDNE